MTKLIELSRYLHTAPPYEAAEAFIVNAAHIIYVRVLGDNGAIVRTIDGLEHYVAQKAHEIFALIHGPIEVKPAEDAMLD
jgi:hypothetical protein